MYRCYIVKWYIYTKHIWSFPALFEKIAHWADKFSTNDLGKLHGVYIVETSSTKTKITDMNDLTWISWLGWSIWNGLYLDTLYSKLHNVNSDSLAKLESKCNQRLQFCFIYYA